ncbi:MAG: RodZ domain-containing protein [candidate division Zixibacteria bacterium]
MSIALGDLLREAREAKGLNIEQLAAMTRLNHAFIEALEEGRWDKLPGQVYLKPFAKTCAEALDLDLKEVYKAIDGEEMSKAEVLAPQVNEPLPESRFDYKLPLVLVVGVIIIGLIYLTVQYQHRSRGNSIDMPVIPADIVYKKSDSKRSGPWEKPAEWEIAHPGYKRLRLEASDQVWVSVLTESDTLYAGFINGGQGRTVFSNSGFTLNIGKNDCLAGFLNGERIPIIGTTEKGLYNYRLSSASEVN